jgi:2'-5' RNA ligase
MARLFFALWPDDEAREALGRLSRDLAIVAEGKPVPIEKVHLTLAFLGEVADERHGDLAEAAQGAGAAAFVLPLDRVGSFRRAKVAWAGASFVPPELLALQSRLAAGLTARGFALDERPFVPHITLARKIARSVPRASIAPIAMAASAIALVRSDLGTGRYATLESWRLDA